MRKKDQSNQLQRSCKCSSTKFPLEAWHRSVPPGHPPADCCTDDGAGLQQRAERAGAGSTEAQFSLGIAVIFLLKVPCCTQSSAALQTLQWKAEKASAAATPCPQKASVLKKSVVKVVIGLQFPTRLLSGEAATSAVDVLRAQAQAWNHKFWRQHPRGSHAQVPQPLHTGSPSLATHNSAYFLSWGAVFQVLSFCLTAVITELMQRNYKTELPALAHLFSE